jgi:hypothetical protein
LNKNKIDITGNTLLIANRLILHQPYWRTIKYSASFIINAIIVMSTKEGGRTTIEINIKKYNENYAAKN